jgi:hypothetical protein
LESNFKFKQQKKACFEAKAAPGKKYLALYFLFEKINALKRQLKPEKTANSKKKKEKDESILSTEINLTTSTDEGENKEYLFTSSKPFISIKTKPANHLTKQTITKLVVSTSLIVNHEEICSER